MNRRRYHHSGQVDHSMPRETIQAREPGKQASSLLRGFLIDTARGLEKQSYYRKLIDFAADRGTNALLWHFSDDQGCSINFESVPGIGSANAFSKSEMTRLIDYAAARGIDLIPELAALGHSRYITRLAQYRDLNENDALFSGICPISPRTREVFRLLVNETAQLFPSRRFHVGLDEVNFGDHPLTKQALQTRRHYEIFADHVNFLHGLLRDRDRQMLMWADGVLKEHEIAGLISRDIVMCNWQYRPEVPPESTQYLLDEGFDVLLFSAMISHDQPLSPGYEFALPNLRALRAHETLTGKGKILGSLSTVWTPVRFMADSLWVGIHLAAQTQQIGPDADFAKSISEFAADFYGIREAADWAVSCDRLFSLIPRREEWLAVAKLNTEYPFVAADLARKASQLGEIARNFRSYVREVRKNQREYRTFLLMADVLAHAYNAAHLVTSGSIASRTALQRLINTGKRLLARVEATWDRERYANDPAKYKPIVDFFRDDHLILILRKGLETLAAMNVPVEREIKQPSAVVAS